MIAHRCRWIAAASALSVACAALSVACALWVACALSAGCSRKAEKGSEQKAQQAPPKAQKLKTFGRDMVPDHPSDSADTPKGTARPEGTQAGGRPQTPPREGEPSPLAGAGVVEGTEDPVQVLEPDKPIKAKEYELKMIAPKKIEVGREAEFRLELTPLGAYKTNKLFPFKVELDAPPAGAALPKTRYEKKDAAVFKPTKVVYRLKAKALTAGAKRFTGLYKFSVCTPKFCELPKAKLLWTPEAQKAGAAAGRKPARKKPRERPRGRKGK